jgi:hypothetical protein
MLAKPHGPLAVRASGGGKLKLLELPVNVIGPIGVPFELRPLSVKESFVPSGTVAAKSLKKAPLAARLLIYDGSKALDA